METTQKNRNAMPLLILLVIVGALIVFFIKPPAKQTDSRDDDSGVITAETICEHAWTSADGSTSTATPNVPGYTTGEHYCGNPAAKVIIVEYTDLECPFCKQFHPTLEKLVYESNGQIGWVLRHYPIDQLHSRARHEAEAAECAGEQQGDLGFWKYVDKVFEVTSSNNSLSPTLLPLIANELKLDRTIFAACLDSGKFLAKIAAQEAMAEANGHGPIGTPNSRIVVGGKEVEEVAGAVDYNTLKAKTDLWLKSE